jgi:prepilin signal peptidase PulO-like enzyme (type II secretory pathway)
MEQVFGLILSIFFGAIFGSYATLFAYRLPLKESCFGRYFGKKSRCPECNNIIKTRDLVPLINWLFTLGRCSNCKVKIPRTHLFIEFTNTIMFLICYLKFGFGEQFIIFALLSSGLIILIATDYTHQVFPNGVLNFVLTIGLVNRVLQDQEIIDLIFSLSIGVIAATIFYQIFYKKTKGLFANQEHSFCYTKFILIASACLHLEDFLFYFLTILTILVMLLIAKISLQKNRNNFGYVLIIPFIWLILF